MTLETIKRIENYLMKYDLSATNFANKFIKIEHDDKINLFMDKYEYHFPYREGCSFTMEKVGLGYIIDIDVNGIHHKIGLNEHNNAEFHDNAKKIDILLKDNNLIFAPAITNEFKNDILNIKQGQIVDLNTRMSLFCNKETDDKIYLKTQYEGSLSDLSIESFKNSKSYIINKKNPNMSELQ